MRAQRTTGATFEGDDESKFVRIHNNDYVQGKETSIYDCYPSYLW